MNDTLTTSEARTQLPSLVRKVARAKPSKTLRDNAVAIRARGEDNVVLLVSEAEVQAAEERIATLEAELEDIALMRLIEERELADTGERFTLEQVAAHAGIGLGDAAREGQSQTARPSRLSQAEVRPCRS